MVVNCCNSGNLEGFNLLGESFGSSIGGIVGSNSGTIINSYNAGTITTLSKNEGNYIGGVVGRDFGGTVKYCYYLKNCATNSASIFQKGIGALIVDSLTMDTDSLTNSFSEGQGLASKGIKGLHIGISKYNKHAALVDCLNAWQAENSTENSTWVLSKPNYPVQIVE